jgi:hypothetical protein
MPPSALSFGGAVGVDGGVRDLRRPERDGAGQREGGWARGRTSGWPPNTDRGSDTPFQLRTSDLPTVHFLRADPGTDHAVRPADPVGHPAVGGDRTGPGAPHRLPAGRQAGHAMWARPADRSQSPFFRRDHRAIPASADSTGHRQTLGDSVRHRDAVANVRNTVTHDQTADLHRKFKNGL